MGLGQVLASAARAGAAHVRRILAVAIVVSMAAALVETAFHELIDRADVSQAVIADVAISGINLLGLVILSGVLSQVVGEAGHGRAQTPLRHVLASLPWRRLVFADLLVAVLVTLGAIALILPGLVLFTYLAVVGPVIEIEHRPVLAALRRSARLVHHHFWSVALLATVPVALADQIPAAVADGAGPAEIVVFLVIKGVGEAIVEAVLGVVLAELAYRLIALDRAASGEAVPASGEGAPAPGEEEPARVRRAPTREQT